MTQHQPTAAAGPLLRTFRNVRDVLRGGDARIAAMLRLRGSDELFQPYGTTLDARYPAAFDFIRAHIGDGPERSILSFGCATGEEVASLRGHFPTARIKGIDISAARIAVCRQRLPADQRATTDFVVAGSTAAEPRERYDALFAMAVFRHNELSGGPPDCAAILPFARFDAAMSGLVDCIRADGFLVLRNTNFRFGDTAAAARFEPVLSGFNRAPLYGRDNRLLPTQSEIDIVFRKLR